MRPLGACREVIGSIYLTVVRGFHTLLPRRCSRREDSDSQLYIGSPGYPRQEEKCFAMDQSINQENNGAKLPLPDIKPMECNGDLKRRIVGVTAPPGSKPIKLQGDVARDFLSYSQSSTLTWLNFTVKDIEKEGIEIATTFGFSESLVPVLLKGYFANFEDRDVELGILLPAVRVKKVDFSSFPLLVLVKKNLILTIHTEDVTRLVNFSRYAETFVRKLPESKLPEDKVTLMLCRIIDENNNRNFEQLREIEDLADCLSESLIDPKAERNLLGKSIYEMKHALIMYLNSLWRTLDVLNNLRYGDADVITDNPKVLAKVNLLVVDVTQQISLSEHMLAMSSRRRLISAGDPEPSITTTSFAATSRWNAAPTAFLRTPRSTSWPPRSTSAYGRPDRITWQLPLPRGLRSTGFMSWMYHPTKRDWLVNASKAEH